MSLLTFYITNFRSCKHLIDCVAPCSCNDYLKTQFIQHRKHASLLQRFSSLNKAVEIISSHYDTRMERPDKLSVRHTVCVTIGVM